MASIALKSILIGVDWPKTFVKYVNIDNVDNVDNIYNVYNIYNVDNVYNVDNADGVDKDVKEVDDLEAHDSDGFRALLSRLSTTITNCVLGLHTEFALYISSL